MKEKITIGSLELSRALALTSDAAIRRMLERISALNFQILKEPETGLVMQTVSDCFNTDFHLGEILVTAAEVMLEDRRGWGMVMGDNGDRATLAACLDVILSSDDIAMRGEVELELSEWLEQAAEVADQEARLYGITRVNFESMAEE
jgi:alpha-D-ribose 1-methylphosphonate 5-triphosphate synthase subunit PhnG